MITDPIADALTRIRNSQLVGHRTVKIRGAQMTKWVLDVLRREGFIEGYKEKREENKPGYELEVQLRYSGIGEPVISSVRRVSSPGCRVYSRVADLPKIRRGLGIALLSTSRGVMSDREARREKIGGEVLAYVG